MKHALLVQERGSFSYSVSMEVLTSNWHDSPPVCITDSSTLPTVGRGKYLSSQTTVLSAVVNECTFATSRHMSRLVKKGREHIPTFIGNLIPCLQ